MNGFFQSLWSRQQCCKMAATRDIYMETLNGSNSTCNCDECYVRGCCWCGTICISKLESSDADLFFSFRDLSVVFVSESRIDQCSLWWSLYFSCAMLKLTVHRIKRLWVVMLDAIVSAVHLFSVDRPAKTALNEPFPSESYIFTPLVDGEMKLYEIKAFRALVWYRLLRLSLWRPG